jgi:hypothetical protein
MCSCMRWTSGAHAIRAVITQTLQKRLDGNNTNSPLPRRVTHIEGLCVPYSSEPNSVMPILRNAAPSTPSAVRILAGGSQCAAASWWAASETTSRHCRKGTCWLCHTGNSLSGASIGVMLELVQSGCARTQVQLIMPCNCFQPPS